MEDNNTFFPEQYIELGVGLAIARQMSLTITESFDKNQALTFQQNQNSLYKPYYYVNENSVIGPITQELIQKLVLDGRVLGKDLVWRPGMSTWLAADRIPELKSLFDSLLP